MITLDDLIAAAMKARGTSPLGGKTVVWCKGEDGDHVMVSRVVLEISPYLKNDASFAICLDYGEAGTRWRGHILTREE